MLQFGKDDATYVYLVTTYVELEDEDFRPCSAVWFDCEKYNPVNKYDLSNHTKWKSWDIHKSNSNAVKVNLMSHLSNLFPCEDKLPDVDSEKFIAKHNEVSAAITDWLKHHQG